MESVKLKKIGVIDQVEEQERVQKDEFVNRDQAEKTKPRLRKDHVTDRAEHYGLHQLDDNGQPDQQKRQ